MKTYKKLQNILTMVAILLSCLTFGQQQNEYINYQGVARDASNEIMASQTIAIGISLRFGSPTTTVLYSETHNSVTTDLSGVFSLQIGTGTINSGIYKDLEWGKLAPYATITLNGTEIGTVALQSVPYANASGKATKMELNDMTNVTGSPTDGQVLKFDGTDWTPAADEIGTGGSTLWTEKGNDIYYNAGKVGIGTSSPTHPLHISSSTSESIKIQSTGTDNWIGFHTSEGFQGYAGISWEDKDMDFGTGLFNTTGKVHLVTRAIPKLTVATNGNVGIGTTSPIAKLDIAGGQWDLNNTEGDFRIGNDTYRLKMGMSTGGGGAGRAHIQAQGGINEIALGTGSSEVLKIKEDAIVVDGEVNRPSTGTANMLPFAYGSIIRTGEIRHGSGNFTVIKSLGRYEILFASEGINPENSTILTTRSSYFIGFIDCVYNDDTSGIVVWILNKDGIPEDGEFSFLIYKK